MFDSRASGSSILSKNETRAIPVAGQAGVPVTGSGITAVVLTLTAVHGGSDGRASVWAGGTTQPDTTSINFQTDEIRTNTVTVALGANGDINLNNVAAPHELRHRYPGLVHQSRQADDHLSVHEWQYGSHDPRK
ncbi:hypothetical protein WDV91_00325 [Curtobacterium flaccumfaciens pv. flaccumfaciens]